MKHILAYIALFFFVSLMSCGHSSGDYDLERSFWPPIEAEADSLVAFLNEKAVHTVYDAADTMVVNRIDSIGRALHNNQLRSRAFFWRAMVQSRRGINFRLEKYLDSAAALCDSAAYPYDYFRIQTQYPFANRDVQELVTHNAKGAELFRETGDSMYYSACLGRLGVLHSMFNDIETSCDFTRRSVRVQQNIGARTQASIQELNLAWNLLWMGDSLRGYEIFGRLLADTAFEKHDVLAQKAEYGIYFKDRNKEYLKKALARSYKPDGPKSLRCLLYATLAAQSLAEGNLDSMMYYKEKAYENWKYAPQYATEIYGRMIPIMEAEGKEDSAQMFREELEAYKRKLDERKRGAELQAASMLGYVDSLEKGLRQNERESENRLWIILAISAFSAAVIALAVVLLSRQHIRTRRVQRKATLSQIQVAEKDRAMAELVDNIGSGDVNASVIARIRAQLTPDSDWERVELMIEKDNPEFAEKLMRKFPHLTQAERRLACLIYLGLDNKHIARLLSIAPESVKKTRHRLRAKLPLGPRDDIHKFLMELGGGG